MSNHPNLEQYQALQTYAEKHGRQWKSKLNAAWCDGSDANQPNGHLLRQVRNQFGPKWLTRWDGKVTLDAPELKLEFVDDRPGYNEPVKVRFARYQADGTIAIMMVDQDGLPWSTATACLADNPIISACIAEMDLVAVKDYSECSGVNDLLIRNGILEREPEDSVRTGYANINLYRLTEAAMALAPPKPTPVAEVDLPGVAEALCGERLALDGFTMVGRDHFLYRFGEDKLHVLVDGAGGYVATMDPDTAQQRELARGHLSDFAGKSARKVSPG